MILHTVQAGDSINSLSQKYNISKARLEQDNNLSPTRNLNIGQVIMVAYPSQTYIVQEGDTIESILDKFGIDKIQLLRNNPQLSDNQILNSGEELVISYDNEYKKINILGYTTTFISSDILKKTLPYLTYINIFGYIVNALGTFADINDSWIIELAKEYNVKPVMAISAITEQGRGSYGTTHSIFSNIDIQKKLIENILVNMKAKGYEVLNLAFFSIIQSDLPNYLDFVMNTTKQLNREGYEVYITLTPHTLGYQFGVKYEQSYYEAFGHAANKVILITYLFGHANVSQVAQTNVNYLKDLLDFVITQIPPQKIFLGLTRIAYDWELPYIEGEAISSSFTHESALSLANQLGSVIQYDEVSQTPYYYYNAAGIEHFVWFKDARSINAILNLVNDYDLYGIAVWNILYYSTIWLLINSQYDIQTITDPQS